MTVIDEVLAAEKAAEEKLVQAKEAAIASISAAKKQQIESIEAAKAQLAETEKTELQTHAKQVEKTAAGIIANANASVHAVQTKFDKNAAQIATKITAALS